MTVRFFTILVLCLFAFSSFDTLQAQCLPTTITSSQGDMFSTCPGDGLPDRVLFRPSTFATLYVFVVTDTNNIIQNSFFGSVTDFEDAGIGVCRVYGVSFSGVLDLPVGENLLENDLSDFCYIISSNYITVIRGSENASMVQTTDGETNVATCPGDGNPDVLSFESIGENTNDNFTFVVTDENDVVLGIPEGNEVDFEDAGIGQCRVYGLSYQGDLALMVGDTLRADDFAIGCETSLSGNYVTIDRTGLSGGTVATSDGETIVETCAGDGLSDVVTFASMDASADENFTYLVTDANNIVLGIPDGNSQDFEGAGFGNCRVFGLAYSGDLLVQAGDDLSDVTLTLATGCAGFSSNFIEVVRLAVNGGTITDDTGDDLVYICPSDGVSNVIHFNSTGVAEGTNFTYIVTDDNDVILGIPEADSVDFDPAGFGACRVYGLSYVGNVTAMPGDTVGVSSLADGCFDFSADYLTVVRDIAEAGNIALLNGGNEITVCAGDGIPDIVTFTGSGASAADFTYIVTDAEGVVLGIPPADSVDFDGAGGGACLVYGISFTGNLSVAVGDTLENVALSDDCYDLTNNNITVIRQDAGDPGMISTINGETEVNVIVGDGELSVLEFQHTGTGGENFTYIVTDDNLEILGIPPGNAVDFEGAGVGLCRVYGLSYSGDLLAMTGDMIGVNALIEGCFNLSDNYVTVIRTEGSGLVLDSVFTIAGETLVYTCPSDDIADEITFMTANLPADLGFTYVVTDDQGTVLGVPAGDSQDFDGTGVGACRVYGLLFAGNLLVAPGDNINVGDLADDIHTLSPNYVTVNRDIPNAGTITSDDSDMVQVCVGDESADAVNFDITSASNSLQTLIVLDSEGVILAMPTGPTVDFEDAGEGVCFVFNMAYTGNILLEVGDTLAQEFTYTDGCFDLTESFVTVTRTAVNGGAVATADSLTSVSIFVNDGVADELSFINENTLGDNFTYVVTDDNGVILGIPDGDTQDFEGAGEGACRVYGLAYAGELTAAAGDTLGMAALADVCFDLSDNFVTVTRIDSSGNLNPGEIFHDNLGTIDVPVQLTLAPNPAQTQTTVSFYATNTQALNLQVFSVTGTLIYQQEIMTVIGLNTLLMDIGEWNNGLYFVRLDGGQETSPVRFLKH